MTPRTSEKLSIAYSAIQHSMPDYIRVSKPCRQLLSCIFVSNPSKRITIPEIKKHPWLLKNFPKELVSQRETSNKVSDEDQSYQSVGEVMKIIQEARTPDRGLKNAICESMSDLKDVEDVDEDGIIDGDVEDDVESSV